MTVTAINEAPSARTVIALDDVGREALAVGAIIASTDKARPILRSVLLDTEHSRLVATDTTILSVSPLPILSGPAGSWMIGLDDVKQILKIAKSGAPELVIDGTTWSVTVGGTSSSGPLGEGDYPNFQQLLDKQAEYPVGLEDGTVGLGAPMTKLAKVGTLVDKRAPGIRLTFHGPLKPADWSIGAHSGLVMPVRLAENGGPGWKQS